MINDSLSMAVQLLGTAFACGLNLYAAVAVLGTAARFDLLAELPPGMRGLENGVVIGTAVGLYAVEAAMDRVPILDHAWEAAHTLIRPTAAALLAVLAFEGAPLWLQLAAAAAAFTVALAAHGAKAGLRLIVSPRWIDENGHLRPRRTMARTAVSLAEDLVAIGVAAAALLFPEAALFVLAAALVLLLIRGPRLWRAAMLGQRALFARTRSLFKRAGWRTRDQVPSSIRAIVPPEPVGRRPVRALPAAVTGMPRAGEYRHGWLIFTCDGPSFAYRSLFRARSAPLPAVASVVVRRGFLTDALEINGNGGAAARTITFFLLKDGPAPDLTAAELTGDDP